MAGTAQKTMNKFFRILGWTLLLIMTLVMGAMVVVQSPRAQTYITQKVLNALQEKIQADVSVGKVHIRPFDYVLLKDILIVDRTPYCDPGQENALGPQDTILQAKYLKAQLVLGSLLSLRAIHLREVSLEHGAVAVVTEPDSMINITRVLSDLLIPPPEEKDAGFLSSLDVKISNFRIQDFRVRYLDMVRPLPEKPRMMNTSAIEVHDVNLTGRSLNVKGKRITAKLDNLQGRERSGLNLRELSGKLTIDEDGAHLTNMRVRDDYSDMRLSDFGILFDDITALARFEQEVTILADLQPSDFSIKTASFFAPELWTSTFHGVVSGKLKGTLQEMDIKDISYTSPDNDIRVKAKGKLLDLTDPERIGIDIDIENIDFTTPSLSRFIEMWSNGVSVDLGTMVPWANFTASGNVKGPLSSLDLAIGVDSGGMLGEVQVNMNISDVMKALWMPLSLDGIITGTNLDLGRILSTDALGAASFTADLSASIPQGGGTPSVVLDSILVRSVSAIGYDFRHLRASGVFSDGALKANLTASDPNLGFILQGEASPSKDTGNFFAKVGGKLVYADLVALGLYKGASDILEVSNMEIAGELRTHPSGSATPSPPYGENTFGSSFIQFSGTHLGTTQGEYDLDPIKISTRTTPTGGRVRLESSLAELSFQGNGDPMKFVDDLIAVSIDRHLPSLHSDSVEEKVFSGTSYTLKATVLDPEPVFAALLPGAYISSGTALDGEISPEGELSMNLKSKIIALGKDNIRGLEVSVNNQDGALSLGADADSIAVQSVTLKNPSLSFSSQHDAPHIQLAFDNKSANPSKGDLKIEGLISRDHKDSLVLGGKIIPSEITLRGSDMTLSSNAISFKEGDLSVRDLLLKMAGGQSLRVDGVLSNDKEGEALSLVASGIDLDILNEFVELPSPLGGFLWADGKLISHTGEGAGPGLSLDLTCKDASLGGAVIGDISVGAESENLSKDGIHVNIACRDSLSRDSILAGATVDTESGSLDGNVHLDRFEIGFIKPILADLLSDFGGQISGDLLLGGPFDRLSTRSDNLRLDDGHFTVALNNVPYRLSGPLSMSPEGVVLKDVKITDPQGNGGTIKGGVEWDHMQNITMNIGARISEMQVLGLGPDEGQPFYGTMYISGELGVKGPLEDLAVDVDIQTEKEGDFHLALTQNVTNPSTQLLTFKEEVVPVVYDDPYEMMLSKIEKTTKSTGKVTLRVSANVNDGVEAFVDIDQESGTQMRGKGNGRISLDLTTPDNTFALGGSFTLSSGNVHINAMNIAYRDFEINEGSSINFAGDVMQSDLNITASYRTKAMIGTLISDSTAMSRRTVFCDLGISGKLSNPEITPSVRVPDLDPLTQAKVELALSTPEQSQRQFLALLLTGGFMPDEQSGISNDSSFLDSTLSDLMARQITNILQYIDIPVDMTLGYRSSLNGNDVFDVGASVSFLDNKLTVNGNFGNKYAGTSGNRAIAGDIDAEYRWNSILFKLFSHSADQYTNYLDNSQRNGLGVAYQRQFDTFKELFTSKKKRKDLELEKATNPQSKKTFKIK